jgi:hypothetical protein
VEHDDVATRISALESELSALKQVVAEQPPATASRRDLMKKIAIAGAGAAAGAVVLAKPAAAATGDNRILGVGQEASNMTYLRNGTATGTFPTGALNTSEATMFWVDNRLSSLPTGHGIRGDGKGVLGRGLWGHSDSDGIGMAGDGGIGVLATGTRAALQVADTGTPPPTRTDAHVKGELTTDANGDLWFCVADGTPGTWRQVSGADTSGQLHLLATPVRVYDSRPGGTNDGPLAGGGSRNISLAGTTTKPAVPAGATGAMVSLTLDSTVSSGFLALFAKGIPWPGNSNANWYTSGQILAVTTVTAVDTTAAATVLAGGPGSTQIIIDVIGYYR